MTTRDSAPPGPAEGRDPPEPPRPQQSQPTVVAKPSDLRQAPTLYAGGPGAPPPADRSTLVPSTTRTGQSPALILDPDESGMVIGGVYRVRGSLGSGAMGVVLLAYDMSLHRNVAIKLVRPELLDPAFRERFAEEAKAMARVNHPNVLQIYAFGEHDGAPYFVMELVRGRTLEDWLAESPAPPNLELALRVLDELCQGVAAIHAADTVHRDLKPSNVLLDADFRPRVADLGLAVVVEGKTPGDPEVVGTPAYMAPEVAFPKSNDPALRARADVYSLACIAYELITRKLPIESKGNVSLMLAHATETPAPPSSVREGLPTAFDHVLLRALAKDPVVRTPTVEAFRLELLAARDGYHEPVRILVAEDDADFREALQLTLAKEFPNAELECVGDGQLALEAFDRKVPSVAILDLQMPSLDGMELTGILRKRASSTDVPIIVLTGSGGPKEWKRLSALGADRFLVKPVHMDDLMTLVRRALRERGHGSIRSAR